MIVTWLMFTTTKSLAVFTIHHKAWKIIVFGTVALAGLVIVWGVVLWIMQAQTLSTQINEGDLYFSVDPGAVLYAGQAAQLSWDTSNLRGIYLNEAGKVGAYQERAVISHCTNTFTWTTLFLNDTEGQFTLRVGYVWGDLRLWMAVLVTISLLWVAAQRLWALTFTGQRAGLIVAMLILLAHAYYLSPVTCGEVDLFAYSHMIGQSDYLITLVWVTYGITLMSVVLALIISFARPRWLTFRYLWRIVILILALFIISSDQWPLRAILVENMQVFPWSIPFMALLYVLLLMVQWPQKISVSRFLHTGIVTALIVLMLGVNLFYWNSQNQRITFPEDNTLHGLNPGLYDEVFVVFEQSQAQRLIFPVNPPETYRFDTWKFQWTGISMGVEDYDPVLTPPEAVLIQDQVTTTLTTAQQPTTFAFTDAALNASADSQLWTMWFEDTVYVVTDASLPDRLQPDQTTEISP